MLTENGIQMFVDGNGDEILAWSPNPSQPCYVVFDLYGQCQQVSFLFPYTKMMMIAKKIAF